MRLFRFFVSAATAGTVFLGSPCFKEKQTPALEMRSIHAQDRTAELIEKLGGTNKKERRSALSELEDYLRNGGSLTTHLAKLHGLLEHTNNTVKKAGAKLLAAHYIGQGEWSKVYELGTHKDKYIRGAVEEARDENIKAGRIVNLSQLLRQIERELTNRDVSKRLHATYRLYEIVAKKVDPSPIMRTINERLIDPHEDTQVKELLIAVIRNAAKNGSRVDVAAQAIRTALYSPEEHVRLNAAEICMHSQMNGRGINDIDEDLEKRNDDRSDQIRFIAARTRALAAIQRNDLGSLDMLLTGKQAVKWGAAAAAIGSEDQSVRNRSIGIVMEMTASEFEDPLLRYELLRAMIVIAKKYDISLAIPALEGLLANGDDTVRRLAGKALVQGAQKKSTALLSVNALATGLDAPEEEYRVEALENLRSVSRAKCALDHAIPKAVAALSDQSEYVAKEAAKTLISAAQEPTDRSRILEAMAEKIETEADDADAALGVLQAIANNRHDLSDKAKETLGKTIARGNGAQQRSALVTFVFLAKNNHDISVAYGQIGEVLVAGEPMARSYASEISGHIMRNGKVPLRGIAPFMIRRAIEDGKRIAHEIRRIRTELRKREGTATADPVVVDSLIPLIAISETSDATENALATLASMNAPARASIEQGLGVIAVCLNADDKKAEYARALIIGAMRRGNLVKAGEVLLRTWDHEKPVYKRNVLRLAEEALRKGVDVSTFAETAAHAARDENEEVSSAAATLLGKMIEDGMGIQNAIGPLVAALEDERSAIRTRASALLVSAARIGLDFGQQKARILGARLDRDGTVRRNVANIIGELQQNGVDMSATTEEEMRAYQAHIQNGRDQLKSENLEERRDGAQIIREAVEAGVDIGDIAEEYLEKYEWFENVEDGLSYNAWFYSDSLPNYRKSPFYDPKTREDLEYALAYHAINKGNTNAVETLLGRGGHGEDWFKVAEEYRRCMGIAVPRAANGALKALKTAVTRGKDVKEAYIMGILMAIARGNEAPRNCSNGHAKILENARIARELQREINERIEKRSARELATLRKQLGSTSKQTRKDAHTKFRELIQLTEGNTTYVRLRVIYGTLGSMVSEGTDDEKMLAAQLITEVIAGNGKLGEAALFILPKHFKRALESSTGEVRRMVMIAARVYINSESDGIDFDRRIVRGEFPEGDREGALGRVRAFDEFASSIR